MSNGPRGLTFSLVSAAALSGKPTNFPNQHPEWALSMGVWGLQVTKTHAHNCFKNISLLGAFSKLIKRFVRKPKPGGILCLFLPKLMYALNLGGLRPGMLYLCRLPFLEY